MTPSDSNPTVASATAASVHPVVHGCKDGGLIPTPENLSRVVAATLCLINKQRAANGLASVHTKPSLRTAATQFSQEMVAENFFDHVSPSGSAPVDRLSACGYIRKGHGFSIAENIAAAGGSEATPDAIVAMWMASPGHRANILSPAYRDTGIGIVAAMPASVGSGPGATYTQDFGSVT
ncbi:MAG TPA: CAP domain-containing protein [Solirubrobacteraceae bacterium]|jgi:uncharacterized protein YkwD|nr:CAP domain-containing protein [Solirubrobacteraceae bacterium]